MEGYGREFFRGNDSGNSWFRWLSGRTTDTDTTEQRIDPMFKTKIFKVAYAITQAEGWTMNRVVAGLGLGSRSYRQHNPGNLRSSIYQTTQEGGFAVFENDMVGIYAVVYQLTLYAKGGSANVKPTDTLATAISKYSGTTIGSPNFNNYMALIEKMAGISRNDQVQSLFKN